MLQHKHHIAMQTLIGNLLRIGVMTAATIVLLGGILYLCQSGCHLPDLHAFVGESARLTSIPAIFGQALAGHGRAIIQAGLLLLILTPIARVILSVFVFALERDRLYVIITLIVLMLLLYSLNGS